MITIHPSASPRVKEIKETGEVVYAPAAAAPPAVKIIYEENSSVSDDSATGGASTTNTITTATATKKNESSDDNKGDTRTKVFDSVHKAVLELHQLRDVLLMAQGREYVRLQGTARSIEPISTTGLDVPQIAVLRGRDFAHASEMFKSSIASTRKVLEERRRFVAGCSELSKRWRLSVSKTQSLQLGGAGGGGGVVQSRQQSSRAVEVDCSYGIEGSALKSPVWSIHLIPGLQGIAMHPMHAQQYADVEPLMTVQLSLNHVNGTVVASDSMWNMLSSTTVSGTTSCTTSTSLGAIDADGMNNLTNLERTLLLKRHDCLSRDVFSGLQRSVDLIQDVHWFVSSWANTLLSVSSNKCVNEALAVEFMNARLHKDFRLLHTSVNRISVCLSDSFYITIALMENDAARMTTSSGHTGTTSTSTTASSTSTSDAKPAESSGSKRYVFRSKSSLKKESTASNGSMDVTSDVPLSAEAIYLSRVMRYGLVALIHSTLRRWRVSRSLSAKDGTKSTTSVKVFQKAGAKVHDPNEGVMSAFINHIKLRLSRYAVDSAIQQVNRSISNSSTTSNVPLSTQWLSRGEDVFGSKADLMISTSNSIYMNIHIDGALITVTCEKKIASDGRINDLHSKFTQKIEVYDITDLKSVVLSMLSN